MWAWLEKGRRQISLPLTDSEAIAWEGRQVAVVGDSDLRDKEQAAAGLRRLKDELTARGAPADLLFLPADGPDKVGLDDFLVKRGAEALAELLATVTTGDRVSTWADMAREVGPIRWVWEGWLAAGFLTMVAAGLEMGKSNLCLRIASCFLRGDPWPDGSPCELPPTSILWCETEAGQAMNLDRARKWGLPLDRIVTPLADSLADVNLDHPDHRRAIAAVAAQEDIGLVIVDSLSGRSTRDEKSAAFGEVTGWLASLARETGKPILLTHHLRKRGPNDSDPNRSVTLEMLRGSTAIAQTARTVWALDKPDSASDWRRLTQINNNLAKPAPPLGLKISTDGPGRLWGRP